MDNVFSIIKATITELYYMLLNAATDPDTARLVQYIVFFFVFVAMLKWSGGLVRRIPGTSKLLAAWDEITTIPIAGFLIRHGVRILAASIVGLAAAIWISQGEMRFEIGVFRTAINDALSVVTSFFGGNATPSSD